MIQQVVEEVYDDTFPWAFVDGETTGDERRCGTWGIYIILSRVGLLSYWGLVKVQIIVQN